MDGGDGRVPISVEVNSAIIDVDVGWRLVLADFIHLDAMQFKPTRDRSAPRFRAAASRVNDDVKTAPQFRDGSKDPAVERWALA